MVEAAGNDKADEASGEGEDDESFLEVELEVVVSEGVNRAFDRAPQQDLEREEFESIPQVDARTGEVDFSEYKGLPAASLSDGIRAKSFALAF